MWPPRRSTKLTAYATVTARFMLMCSRPVRNAVVRAGMASRSSAPTAAAARAPSTPMAISHSEPRVRNPGRRTMCEAMSNVRLDTQAPIGTVTKIGWNG